MKTSARLRFASKRRLVGICVTLGAFAAVAGNAYSWQQTGGGASKGGSRDIEVKPTGDHFSDVNTPIGQIWSGEGHVVIISDDSTLHSEKATYNEKTGVANSPGLVTIDDKQNTVVGDTGTAYYSRHDARITGHVHITVRPKPDAANAPENSARREFKEPLEITSDSVDYNWRSRVGISPGHVMLVTGDHTVTADKGTYYGKEERLHLDGHVHYVRKNGDTADLQSADAILTEGKESFSGVKGTGVFHVKEDPEDNPENGSTTPVAPGPTTPATPAPGTSPSTKPESAPVTPANPPASPPSGAPATQPSTVPPPVGGGGGKTP